MFACEKYRLKIESFAEGELSPAESAEFSRHLVVCSECRADLELSRSLAGTLNSMKETEPPAFLISKIMTDIEVSKGASVKQREGFHLFKIMAFVAGLISIPFFVWLIKNALTEHVNHYRIENPLQGTFIVKLFLTIARSIASLFNDSPVATFSSSASGGVHPFHFMMVFAIVVAASLLLSSFILYFTFRKKLHIQN